VPRSCAQLAHCGAVVDLCGFGNEEQGVGTLRCLPQLTGGTVMLHLLEDVGSPSIVNLRADSQSPSDGAGSSGGGGDEVHGGDGGGDGEAGQDEQKRGATEPAALAARATADAVARMRVALTANVQQLLRDSGGLWGEQVAGVGAGGGGQAVDASLDVRLSRGLALSRLVGGAEAPLPLVSGIDAPCTQWPRHGDPIHAKK
jgi:hypothetical protein